MGKGGKKLNQRTDSLLIGKGSGRISLRGRNPGEGKYSAESLRLVGRKADHRP